LARRTEVENNVIYNENRLQQKTQNCNNSFIKKKIASKPILSAAIRYGQRNEDIAIRCYLEHQDKKGLNINVKRCGLFVNPAIPWLAATPDSVVEIGPDTGCL